MSTQEHSTVVENGKSRRRVRRPGELTLTDQQRFLSLIEKCFHHPAGKECCFLWTGKQNANGYGWFRISRDNTEIGLLSHRIAWEHDTNAYIPEGLFCCHKCDIRLCCNPSHLFLGTQKENLRDMVRKGRANPFIGKGEKNPAAKLTQQEVDQIRELHAKRVMTNKALAAQFKRGKSQRHNIVSGANWRNGHE